MPPKRRQSPKSEISLRVPQIQCALETLKEIVESLPQDDLSQVIAETLLNGDFISYCDFQKSPALQSLFGNDYLDQPRLLRYNPWTEQRDEEIIASTTKDMLLADILASRAKLRLNVTVSDPATHSHLAAQILNGINQPLRQVPAVLMNVPSPRLDAIYATPPLVASQGRALRRTDVSVNIGPYLSFVDLHHDDAHGTQTLTSGRKLWVFFPPTPSNLAALRLSYLSSANSTETSSSPTSPARRYLEALNGNYFLPEGEKHHEPLGANPPKLSTGIVLIQTTSTNIWVPPFCPHAVFTLQSSVLLGREYYLPRTLPLRIEQLSLFGAYAKCVRDAATGQIGWMVEVMGHICSVIERAQSTARAAKGKKRKSRSGMMSAKDGEALDQATRVEPLSKAVFLSWASQYENVNTFLQNLHSLPDATQNGLNGLRKQVIRVWKLFLEHREVQAWTTCPACDEPLNKANRRNHLWEKHLIPCHSWKGWGLHANPKGGR